MALKPRPWRLVSPVLAAIVVHGFATAGWPAALMLGVAATLAAFVPVAGPATPTGRLRIYLAGGALGVLIALAAPANALDAAVGMWARVVSAGALGAAAVAVLLRAPAGAAASPVTLSLAAVVAGGMGNIGPSYVASVALFVVGALAALAADERGGPSLLTLARRRVVASLAAGVVGVGLAVGLVLALPPASTLVGDWVLRLGQPTAFSGLSDGIWLAPSTDIHESGEIVLRVRGDGAALLRGFVLTRYNRGRWSRGAASRERIVTGLSSVPSAEPERVRLLPAGRSARYFFPLGASRVSLVRDRAAVDQYGQWSTPDGEDAAEGSFVMGAGGAVDIAPPSALDTTLPPALAAPLAELARAWTAGASSTEERLARMVDRLHSDFVYSLRHERKTQSDPVLDFLLHSKTGHCEYFASSLALLARSSGIPARVVTGYRAHERNPFGGYRVVRERDAHAWVEAWVDGRGWTSHDPTPPSYLEALPDWTAWLGALFDWAGAGASDGDAARKLRARLPVIALVIAGGAALVARLRRRRRGGARPAPGSAPAPWPGLQELLRLLAESGWPHEPWESLERYVRRLRAHAALRDAHRRALDTVEAYARHRYGGLGARDALEAQLAESLRELGIEGTRIRPRGRIMTPHSPLELTHKAPTARVRPDITEAELRQWVDRIAIPRHHLDEAAANRAVADVIAGALAAQGYDVGFQGRRRNVVARAPVDPDGAAVLVGAHYDSVPRCPGADDNARAVAVMLAAAGALARAGRHRSATFVAFNAEEDGMLGSHEFAAALAQRPAAAHVLEMVGFTSAKQHAPPGLPVTLPPRGDFLALLADHKSRDLLARTFALPAAVPVLAVQAAAGVEDLIVDLVRSDHAQLWNVGVPCLMWTDTADYRNPHYHLPTDTPDTLDYTFMAQVASLLVAAIGG